MKKLMLVLFLVMVCMSTNAYAISTESWIIDISSFSVGQESLYDWGTLYTYSSGTWTPVNNLGASSLTDGVAQPADAVEDSFGIFRVKSIVGSQSGVIFDASASSDQIVGLFYGLDDVMIQATTAGKADVYSTGGRLSLWRNSGDFIASADLGPGAKTGSTFPGITTGTKLLEADGHLLGALDAGSNPFAYTYSSEFRFTAPFGGSGDIYWDVDSLSGGAWADLLNTDGFDTGAFGPADIYINFSSQPTTRSTWIVQGNGYGNANAVVPEPASMILMGIGLAGAAMRRKRMG